MQKEEGTLQPPNQPPLTPDPLSPSGGARGGNLQGDVVQPLLGLLMFMPMANNMAMKMPVPYTIVVMIVLMDQISSRQQLLIAQHLRRGPIRS